MRRPLRSVKKEGRRLSTRTAMKVRRYPRGLFVQLELPYGRGYAPLAAYMAARTPGFRRPGLELKRQAGGAVHVASFVRVYQESVFRRPGWIVAVIASHLRGRHGGADSVVRASRR